jgi:hypothetical protein
LEQRATLLGLQVTDLVVCEGILAEELERGLHPLKRWDSSMELDKVRARVDRIADDRAAEAEWLSCQVAQVAGVLTDLGLLPIEDIPQLSKTAQEVLPVVALILKCLQEARDS